MKKKTKKSPFNPDYGGEDNQIYIRTLSLYFFILDILKITLLINYYNSIIKKIKERMLFFLF